MIGRARSSSVKPDRLEHGARRGAVRAVGQRVAVALAGVGGAVVGERAVGGHGVLGSVTAGSRRGVGRPVSRGVAGRRHRRSRRRARPPLHRPAAAPRPEPLLHDDGRRRARCPRGRSPPRGTSRSRSRQASTGPSAVTVAVRGTARSSAISPSAVARALALAAARPADGHLDLATLDDEVVVAGLALGHQRVDPRRSVARRIPAGEPLERGDRQRRGTAGSPRRSAARCSGTTRVARPGAGERPRRGPRRAGSTRPVDDEGRLDAEAARSTAPRTPPER